MPRVRSHRAGDFNWYDLMTHDLEASKRFYGGLFGWRSDDQPTEGREPYTLFSLDDETVAGGAQTSEEMRAAGVPTVWNVYVSVDELEPVLERVTARGGQIVFPPMDVFDHGRLAYVGDPEGATVALWQPKEHIGSGRVHEPGTVCWSELASRDLDGAERFYREVFGWETKDNPFAGPSGYRVLTNGGREIGGILGMTEEWGEMPAHWSVYFETAEIEDATRRIADLGGTVRHGPFDTPVGKVAVCADDVGAHFYLMQLTEERKAARSSS